MRYTYMRDSDGFLLIYSVRDRYSFEDISILEQQILRVKDKDTFPMIVVGNDCLEFYSPTARIEVSKEEGQALANRMGCPFMEVDATSGYNVEKAFVKLVQEIRSYRSGLYGYY